MKPAIIVTGKNGQLGNELQVASTKYPQFNFFFTDREELDITDVSAVTQYFENYKPSYCINAAAYTAVDKAETDKEQAYKVNAEAAGNLSKACNKHATQYIHVSTDYVYDGLATSPYKEDHPTDPVNYYGLTKRQGEEQALANCPASIVIRTSWVYSSFGNNFVKTMMRLMAQRESLNVVSDQFGSPTYARDLAEAIMQIITLEKDAASTAGIYHYSNEGLINWYDFAVEIKKLSGCACNVHPIPTSKYPTPAKRPGYSVMDKTKIKDTFNIELRDWKESLKECIELLQK